MAVLGNDDEIYGFKRKWENREFSSDCSNKPKYKQRKVSARRDFPTGFTKNLNPKVANVKSDYEPEKLEDDVLSQPIFEAPEKLEDDKSQPICQPPEILYARNDYPVVFYQIARKVFAKRDFPEAFYANSSHFVRRVEREESESELEDLEEAIGTDDDKTEESKCESYNVARKVFAKRDFPEAFYANSRRVEREESESEHEEPEAFFANSRRVEREGSESELEEREEAIGSDDDKTEESKYESYNVARKVFAKRDFPEEFYANSRRVESEESESELEEPEAFYANSRRVEREESESEPEEPEAFYANSKRVEREGSESELEELEEAICSDDDKTEESKCESYNAGKMELSESVNNQIVGSTKLLDSNRITGGAVEEREDYVQHMLAFLDHMKATLMQKYSRKISAHSADS